MFRFVACKEKVLNRGIAPDEFLLTLVNWGKTAHEDIFAPMTRDEIYVSVHEVLGPFSPVGRPHHRKAVMLEVLRVLEGFESSWRWDAGVDTTNADSNQPCTMEAGAFQVSGNSMDFHPSLEALVMNVAGTLNCHKFQEVTKANHPFAVEYCARLLRFTTQHHGPVKHLKMHPWLSRDAVNEFEGALAE